MKQFIREILVASVFGLLVPALILHVGMQLSQNDEPEQIIQPSGTSPTVASSPQNIRVQQADGTVQVMELDDYLVGVLLAEMPASFEQEAKKAQIVVARTYAMRSITEGGKHDDAAVCVESACCQGYLSEDSYLELGGNLDNITLLQNLVTETDRQVLVMTEH